MSSQAFVRFREGIRKLHGDDCFVEFLQQLFPWVSITAGASSAACQIRSATDEISKFLHAAHDDDREGFVRLIRSTTERPRTSWIQLLHGPKTIRLPAKLSNFILDVFSFARPNMTILQYACRDAVHQNGFFEARWELVYLTSDGATPAGTAMVSDCPPLVDTMSVFVQVESPAEQGHLEAPVRDVIIRIKSCQIGRQWTTKTALIAATMTTTTTTTALVFAAVRDPRQLFGRHQGFLEAPFRLCDKMR